MPLEVARLEKPSHRAVPGRGNRRRRVVWEVAVVLEGGAIENATYNQWLGVLLKIYNSSSSAQ